MGFFTLDRWIEEGYLRPYSEVEDYDAYLQKLFCYDDLACVYLRNLGWCEAEFEPLFENKVLEDRGDYELVQDTAD